MIDKAKILLTKDWPEEQYNLIKRLFDNLISYRAFIPGALKNDIIAMLDIAISIKDDYEKLKSRERDLIKECIHDMVHDKKVLVDGYSQTEICTEICTENESNKSGNNLIQPFSLVVSEDGTITFTVKSKSDEVNDTKNIIDDETKIIDNKEIDDNKNIINDTEIIEKQIENDHFRDKVNKKKNSHKKGYRWKSLFCF